MCNECVTLEGDAEDNLIRFITGHIPNCKNFKIEKEKFIDEFNAQVNLITARKLDKELVELFTRYNKIINPQPKEMSSTQLVKKLFNRLSSNYYPIITNSYVYTWESDLLALNKNTKYVTEYEIKTSRADFKADFKKEDKHKYIELVFNDGIENPQSPNHFYYVTTPGLLDRSEIPEYAGLIQIGNSITFTKRAPLLHKNKAEDGFDKQLLTKAYYKFWNKYNENKSF